jgi:hypothetical protein
MGSEEKGIIKMRKRKRFVNKLESKTLSIIIKITMVMAILEIYFFYNFFSTKNLFNSTTHFIKEMNLTAMCEWDFLYAINTQ